MSVVSGLTGFRAVALASAFHYNRPSQPTFAITSNAGVNRVGFRRQGDKSRTEHRGKFVHPGPCELTASRANSLPIRSLCKSPATGRLFNRSCLVSYYWIRICNHPSCFFGSCGPGPVTTNLLTTIQFLPMMSFFPHFVVASYGLQIGPRISAGGWGGCYVNCYVETAFLLVFHLIRAGS
jgi:hypothetical protein